MASRIARPLLNTLLTTLGFAVAVIIPARGWNWHAWGWGRGWVLIGVLLVVDVIGTLRIVRAHPDLLRERARVGRQPGRPFADTVLILAWTISYTAMLIVSSADAARWHLWPAPPAALAWVGLALAAFGSALVHKSLETNAFAVRVVRHQPERGHRVVDAGVYSIVRHPMYAGLCLAVIGIPLWLGSTLGVLCALVPILTLAIRISVEERVLCANVPGYPAYTDRVRHRLVPGVW